MQYSIHAFTKKLVVASLKFKFPGCPIFFFLASLCSLHAWFKKAREYECIPEGLPSKRGKNKGLVLKRCFKTDGTGENYVSDISYK